MVNISSFLLPANPLSFSQYGRELYLAWKGQNNDTAFPCEMQATTLGPECSCIFQHWHFRHRPQAQNVSVQMSPQAITEKPPSSTVGCRCLKENFWDGSRRPRFDRCQKTVQTRTHQRRQRYPKTPQACLSSLTPLLSALNVERSEKWLPSSSSTAIPKGMEIADNSSWVFLNYFGHISCSWGFFCTDLLTAQKVLSVGCGRPGLGEVLSLFSLLNCTNTGERNLEVFCYQLVIATPSVKFRKLHRSFKWLQHCCVLFYITS